MIIESITRKSSLAATLLLIAIVVAEMLRAHLAPFAVEVAASPYRPTVLAIIISAIILIVNSVVLGKLFLRSGLHKGYNTLPIPIFGVLACGIFVAPDIVNGTIVALLLTLASLLLVRSLSIADEKNALFFASLLLGVCPLLLPPSIVLIVLIPLATLFFALSPRQLFIMAIGYALPMGAASYVMWYRGDSITLFGENLWHALIRHTSLDTEAIPYLATIMVALIVLTLIGGVLYAMTGRDNILQQNKSRRSLRFFASMLIVVLSMAAMPSADLTILPIVAVPMTIMLCFALSVLQSSVSTILYWILLLLTLLHLFVM